MNTQIAIVNGPSKFDVMVALFTRMPTRPWVRFQTGDLVYHNMYIDSVQTEDGSGEAWNIKGMIVGENVSLYYRTDTRKGHLRVL